MHKRRCRHCRCYFQALRNPNQAYCSAEICQKKRRNCWKHNKSKRDSDYRDNKKFAQEKWRQSHPNYYKQYRSRHPDYVVKNRAKQHLRNQHHRVREGVEIGEGEAIAKRNALLVDFPLITSPYEPIDGDMPLIAKRNAFPAIMFYLSRHYRQFFGNTG
jgi:hypothetical protein